jgi:hypothetical protein
MLGLSIPNLDAGGTADELVALAEVFDLLREYSVRKAMAMRARAMGNIPSALVNEQRCEKIYNRLPADVRW